MIWLYYRIGLNEINSSTTSKLFDLDLREISTLLPLVVLVFIIGLYPEFLFSYMHVSVEHLLRQVHLSSVIENFTFNDAFDGLIQILKTLFISG